MAQNQFNSVITTTSAVCGGLGKAVTAHMLLLNVSFQGILEVAVYASVSAIVGYGVKKGIDKVATYFKRK